VDAAADARAERRASRPRKHSVRDYDSRLLQFLLRAHRPDIYS
jgi:hypothetical protein